MRTVFPHRIWALLILFLCFHAVVAHVAQPLPRQDDGSATTSTVKESTTSSSATGDAVSTSASTTITSSSTGSSTLSTTASVVSSSVSATSTSSSNSTMFNSEYRDKYYYWDLLTLEIGSIADGELPLTPALTPGWGVAGTLLIVTGASYALIGIKTRWIYCFFSVAFLAAVGVTVLILYVMTVPISNAIQGAYVVAVVCTGVALGGVGLIFRDILECLGCLLGGFCLSMWLLTLKAGGLTGSGGAGTVIFICVFSGAGFAGYFSRWTRPQYMIACIALNGATATVIGIDCFSRAGLKEFWAWIWDLNDNLFPYDANTYPLTRGIRVEQAITIILMLGGIISQSRLWNVIKERRARREEARRKEQEAIDSANIQAGGEIERINARERREWEAVHGDPKSPTSVHTAYDSGVGDLDSEKKSRHSGTATTATRPSEADDMEGYEMAEPPADVPTNVMERREGELSSKASPKTKTAAELVMGKSEKEGMVTVRVAVDEFDAVAADEHKSGLRDQREASVVDETTKAHLPKSTTQALHFDPNTPVPEVIPLPFNIPHIETDEHEDGNRSSFATFADLEDELPARRSIDSPRSSFAKRLSAGSTSFRNRLSHNSSTKQLKAAQGPRESQEDLTSLVHRDRDSVAATFDEVSSLGEDDARSRSSRRISADTKAELADKPENGTDVIVSEPVPEGDAVDTASSSSSEKDKKKAGNDEDSKQGKSVASETESKAASLTKDRLPRALSKIALSYRTNEWAKHLSHAEIPTPEELHILEPIEPQIADVDEAAAPVNVDDLQKTAENAAPPPAMPRTVSAMSLQQSRTQSRVSSAQRPANLGVPAGQLKARSPPLSPSSANPEATSAQSYLSPNQTSSKRSSAKTVGAIAEEEDYQRRMSSESRQAAVRAAAAALTGEASPRVSSLDDLSNPVPANASSLHSRAPVPGIISYNSPQTLIGKRDLLLRAKNQALNRPESSLRGNSMIQASDDANNATAAAYGTVPALGPSRKQQGYADNNSPSHRASGAPQQPPVDLDDLPLNQRKAFIKGDPRRNSMSSANSNKASPGDGGSSRRSSFGIAQRRSDLPSQVARESQNFKSQHQQPQQQFQPYSGAGIRQSSSYFPLQAGNVGGAGNNANPVGGSGSGPLINQVYGIPGTSSSNILLPHQTTQVWDAEVRRDIDVQRQFLMNQKEIESRRRESARVQRESLGRRFERRMRTDSQMMEAHREAMRKMQRDAK